MRTSVVLLIWALATAIFSLAAYAIWAFVTWSLPAPGSGFRFTVVVLAIVMGAAVSTAAKAVEGKK